MGLKQLLIIHAVITFAAGFVLMIAPALIPSTVDVSVSSQQYLLCYFLAAAEFAIAYLSFFSIKIEDIKALQIICTTFIIFHTATGLLEIYAWTNGLSGKIWGNVVLRIVIVILFAYYGQYKYYKKKKTG